MAGLINTNKCLYLVFNFFFRCVVIYIATLVDNSGSAVKFTDTDYDVFSDAAAHVAGGGSPFARKTYRYTPLAAYVCLVNPWVHPLACKFIFVAFDLLIAFILWDLVELQLQRSTWKSFSDKTICFFVSVLVLQPAFFVMSCRGSNDQIIQALIFLALYLVLKRWYVLGGFIYGLSIHFKIYPIIFSFVLYFYIECDRDLIARGGSPYLAIISKKGFFTKNRLVFTLMTVITFVGLTAFFYRLYGYEFLYEAYLYHFIRKDHRHNNSVYWYLIYQLFDEPNSTLIGILTFVPQWSLVLVSGFAFYYDVFFACFVQVFCFVMFNKVITAQYYLWYSSFWPLILINNRIGKEKPVYMLVCFLLCLCAQSLWVYYANAFENGGEQTMVMIQAVNFLFLFCNMGVCLYQISNQELHLQAEFVTVVTPAKTAVSSSAATKTAAT